MVGRNVKVQYIYNMNKYNMNPSYKNIGWETSKVKVWLVESRK